MIISEKLDSEILFFINRTIRNEFFDSLFVFFSDRKSLLYVLPILIAAGYFFKRKGKDEFKKFLIVAFLTIIAVSVSDIISSRIMKPFFHRPRPCQILEGLYFWKSKAELWVLTDGFSSYKSSFSFVSSHASNSISGAFIFGIFYKKLIPLLVFSVVLIGISRLYLGHHYPSDVLAGWATGIIISIIIIATFNVVKKRYLFLRI